ncbi:helix-turn-helix domain-containing protein [Yinghuangia sp. YIM S09857]|uniref:PucR family transcriptional regulator n=1 Tax=Yinghuangia sp. YIM S09857 TaxID=3436929 RepID=UPI003F53D49F
MGIGGDSGSAGPGGQPPARSGDGESAGSPAPAPGAAGRESGSTGRHIRTGGKAVGKSVGKTGNAAGAAAGSGTVAGKAGTVAKVAKSGTVGASGVVSSTQAAGTGTRETVRPLPVKRRVRGGTVAAAEGRAEPAVTVPAPDEYSECLPGTNGPVGDPGALRSPGRGVAVDPAPEPGIGAERAVGRAAGLGAEACGDGGDPCVEADVEADVHEDADADFTPDAAADHGLPRGGLPGAPGRIAAQRVPGNGRSAANSSASAAASPATSVPADAAADALGLARVWLPAATQALAVATRLAEAATEAGDSAGELKYQADLLRDLLTGRLDDPDRLPPDGLAGLLDRRVTVLVAEPDPLPDDNAATLRRHQDALAAAWTAAVRAADPDAVVSGYPGEIVALITVPPGAVARGGAADAGREAAARVRAACARIRRTFTTGISRPVRGIEALPAAYEQARRAVAAGRRLQGPGAVTDFDRLGVFRLLSLLPVDGELERFAAEILGPLAEPQDAETGELRRTLQVLLETNLNVAETSRRLYVHYNTLRYRIGKLERLVGPFTQDSRLRLDLLIALEIVHLTDTAPPPA